MVSSQVPLHLFYRAIHLYSGNKNRSAEDEKVGRGVDLKIYGSITTYTWLDLLSKLGCDSSLWFRAVRPKTGKGSRFLI